MRNSQQNESNCTKKYSRWTPAEDRALVNAINILLDLGGLKAYNGQFKTGAWTNVEAIMQQKSPSCEKKVKPRIDSRVKLLRKPYDALAEMLGPSASGFGQNDEGKFVTCRVNLIETYNELDKKNIFLTSYMYYYVNIVLIVQFVESPKCCNYEK